MNRYMLIRRLRGPAYLLLLGIMALLNQTHILSWGKSWPLWLILVGVLALAERAALASEEVDQIPPPNAMPPYPGSPYPGAPYPGAPYPPAPYPGPGPAVAPESSTALVPTEPHDLTKDPNGGRS